MTHTKEQGIITSSLDTDMYKLTMGQAVLGRYKDVNVGYGFINRGKTEFPDNFDKDLQKQLELISKVKLKDHERKFLAEGCNDVFKNDYLDWFSQYQFNPDEVFITRQDAGLDITVEGPWSRTIYWEVPLMAIISETFFEKTGQTPNPKWIEKTQEKGKELQLAGAKFVDMGTRRRFSYFVQDKAVEALKKSAGSSLLGTSNLHFAQKHKLTPVGTMAHEWIMAHSAMFGFPRANETAIQAWLEEYQGKLAVALTDTFTTDIFLRDFGRDMAQKFVGLRQDSGNPKEIADKFINFYKSHGIDPMTKKALFSDSLNVEKVLDILKHCEGKINSVFGIGTNFTNDVGVKPLNMVIKLMYLQSLQDKYKINTCKFSDDPGKTSGATDAVQRAQVELGLNRDLSVAA